MYIFQPDRVLLKEQIQKHAAHIKGVVLDVGAGKNKRYIAHFHYDKYITLDIDPDTKPDILAPADKIPFEEKSVDSIICTQVLGDVTDPQAVINEFYRVLRPGGIVLLTESFINEMHNEPIDYWRYTKYGLENLFKNSGFKILSIDQRGGFFSVKAQNNIRYFIDRFKLYSHRWSRFLNPFIAIYGNFMMFLDKIDGSRVNKKFALGWCAFAQKPESKSDE